MSWCSSSGPLPCSRCAWHAPDTWAEVAIISQVVITPLVVITPVVGWPRAAHVVGANGREAGRSLVMCVYRLSFQWKSF